MTASSLDRQFKRDVVRLVVPSVLQMLIGNSFSLINTLMVGRLGDTAIAVVAAAGQIGFVVSMILTAVYGINAFITQFHGSRDEESLRKAFGLMLLSGLAVTVTLAAAAYAFRQPLLTAFINDPHAVQYGVHYVTILLFVYMLSAVKDAYGNALGAVGNVRPTLIIGLIAMSVNVVFDYALIYGRLGFPRYGIEGAAWSTLCSSLVGTVLLLGYVYRRSRLFNVSLKEICVFKPSFAKRIYATTLPLVFHEGLWSVGNMLYAVAFGYMGVSALATFQLARTFNGYFMMGIFGFAYAANVMIGQKLGQDDKGEAIAYARKFTKLSLVSALIVSAAVAVASPFIDVLFSRTSAEVQIAFRHVMLIQAAVMAMYFLNNVWIVGMFRAGGDNAYTLKLIAVTTWLIALPLVFAGAYLFHWRVETVYLMFAMEEVSKAVIGFFRYRSNRWANNLVRNM